MPDNPADPSRPSLPPEGASPPRPGAKMIDVKGMIRQASARVNINELVKQGRKTISVLSKERMEEMINQAVRNIVDKYRAMAAGVAQVPVEQITAESKDEFNELMRTYQETAKAKEELSTSKALLDGELDELRKDLEKQKALAEGRLSEEAEKALVIGFKEFERELDKQVVKVFDKRKAILAESNPEAVPELKEVENVIRPIIARLVAAERERFQMAGGQSRETQLLEKRIEKLYAQINAMETALRTISQSKVYSNQQINNVLRQLGLSNEDKNAEKKKEMLKFVLTANKDIQRDGKTLAEKGITLANPQGFADVLKTTAPPPAPASPSPEPPKPA